MANKNWVPGANMTFYQILEAFKVAVEGKDVKDKMYWMVKHMIDTFVEGGNANFEVKLSRGRFKDLASRLDDADARLSGISAAPKGVFSNYTDLKNAYPGGAQGIYLVLADGHWYYWKVSTASWTSGGTYQGTEVPNESITFEKLAGNSVRAEKTNFLEYGEVVPPSNGVYASFPLKLYEDTNYNGYMVQANGQILSTGATAYLTTTDFVPLFGGLTYKAIFRSLLFYDANDNMIAGSFVGNPELYELEFNVPLTAVKARFSVAMKRPDFDINNIQIKRMSATDDDRPLRFTRDVIGLGGGGEAYDQSLNTADSVKFVNIQTDALEITGDIKVGTLASPPSGLLKGDMWADTTDSTAHPIVRVKL